VNVPTYGRILPSELEAEEVPHETELIFLRF
jgi:hypothetical protein